MIIFSIIEGILVIVITLIYLRDNLGKLFENRKISRKSLNFLRGIRAILYILVGITLLFLWVTFINIKTHKIILSVLLIILDFGILAYYKRKTAMAISKMELKKKKARIRQKQDIAKRKQIAKKEYRSKNYS